MGKDDLDHLERLLRDLAEREVMARMRHARPWTKADGSLVTEADLAMQAALAGALGRVWPDIPLLGEEMPLAQQEVLCARGGTFWCLDPIDGTTNYAAGLPFFCVSLALVDDGQAVAGLVLDPWRGECFSALRGRGAWLNGQALASPQAPGRLADCIAVVDLKRLPLALAERLLTETPVSSLRNFGAVALEWCWLAAGRTQLYLHGGQKCWDWAAGGLVAAEAGAALWLGRDLYGPPCAMPAPGSWMGLGAADAGLLRLWRDWLLQSRA